MKIVGTRVRPIDWDERTVGGVPYTGDLDFDGMLEAKVLWSTGVGDIRSISTTVARAMPGVAAVITAADFGDVHYIHEGGDKSDRHPLASGRIRYLGEPVAAVAADSAEHAAAAVAAIRVRYRPRRLPTRVDEALAVGAPRVHDRASGSNVSIETAGSWGDPEASASIAERWLSGTWFYPRVTHLCLEPNITVARWDEAAEKLELWTSTHAPYFIVKEVANALGLETDQVVCREVAVGGGFGSKSKISEHEVLAAKLSTATGRPIRLAFSRDEEFAFTKTRHGSRVMLRPVTTRQGLFTPSTPNSTSTMAHTTTRVIDPRGRREAARLDVSTGLAHLACQLVDTALRPAGRSGVTAARKRLSPWKASSTRSPPMSAWTPSTCGSPMPTFPIPACCPVPRSGRHV